MDIVLWIVGIALVGVAWVFNLVTKVRFGLGGILIKQNHHRGLPQRLPLLVLDGLLVK